MKNILIIVLALSGMAFAQDIVPGKATFVANKKADKWAKYAEPATTAGDPRVDFYFKSWGEALQANSSLASKQKDLVSDYNRLANKYNMLLDAYNKQEEAYRKLDSAVTDYLNAVNSYQASVPQPVKFSWSNLISSSVRGGVNGYTQSQQNFQQAMPKTIYCGTNNWGNGQSFTTCHE